MDEDVSNTNNLINQNYSRPAEQPASPFSKKRQVTAAFVATLGCFLNGCVIGFTGPAIPSIISPDVRDVYGFVLGLDMQQASWVTSILSIGCFIGCLVAGPVMERIGRKKSLMLVSAGNYAVGFLLILLANTSIQIYIGRFLNGVGLGFVLAVVSVYIVEIATTDMRGILGCFVQFQGSVGVLFTFCLGAVLSWWQLAAAHLLLVIPFVVSMIFIPESPRWLVLKGNEWEGEVALKWLRGRDPQGLDREIEQIKREIAIRKRERVSITMLLEPQVLKPFLLSLMMMFFLQFSGFNVMVFYCATIFQQVGSSVQSHIASIIVGAVLLLSCFVSLIVVVRLPRKVILLVSILGMGLAHVVLGTCFHFHQQQLAEAKLLHNSQLLEAALSDQTTTEESSSSLMPLLTMNSTSPNSTTIASVTDAEANSTVIDTATTGSNEVQLLVDINNQVLSGVLGWLPLVAVVSFLFIGNLGFGTLIWVVTAELLPPKVRSVANSVIISFAFVSGFLVAKTFVDLIQSIGLASTFWLYAGICFTGAIFTLIFVPETRGRSIEEIEEHFRPKVVKLPVRDEHPLETVS